MKLLERSALKDYQTYNEERKDIRGRMLKIKDARRIHVGPFLTFLFENRDTIWYQVQEMMRVEQIVKEADIQHELATYNELLGGPGELGCTLLIEIETPEARNKLLREWLDLPNRLFVQLEDGQKIRASFDPRQIGEDRLSSVQYLKFNTSGQTPVAMGCDLEGLSETTQLTQAQHQALREDLADDV